MSEDISHLSYALRIGVTDRKEVFFEIIDNKTNEPLHWIALKHDQALIALNNLKEALSTIENKDKET